MKASAEVRWFLKESVPSQIVGWFKGGDIAAKNEGARWDIYFNLPGNDNLSIKLREGKLQIKQRKAELGFQRWRDDVEGRVEEWVKWSFTLDNNNREFPDLSTPDGAWVSVKKSRWLKKYEVTMKDEVKAVDADHQIDQGCNIELTEILVNGQTWWSLGCEAFGKAGRVEKNLRLVLARVLSDQQFPSMRAEHSYGYPMWLGLTLEQDATS